jgi:hypothetical protein
MEDGHVQKPFLLGYHAFTNAGKAGRTNVEDDFFCTCIITGIFGGFISFI